MNSRKTHLRNAPGSIGWAVTDRRMASQRLQSSTHWHHCQEGAEVVVVVVVVVVVAVVAVVVAAAAAAAGVVVRDAPIHIAMQCLVTASYGHRAKSWWRATSTSVASAEVFLHWGFVCPASLKGRGIAGSLQEAAIVENPISLPACIELCIAWAIRRD